MATYKEIFLLVDKISAPLRKIQENTRKATEKASKFRASLDKLTSKLSTTTAKINALGAKVGAFSKRVAGAFAAITGTITLISGAILRGSNRVAELGDRIDKMSQKIGMNRRNFQEWDYILSQNGGSIESLQMGFKTIANQMNGVVKGSKESKNAFDALGISIYDNNGVLRSQDDVFNDVVNALQKETNATKKAILGNQLFGRSFIEMKPLLNQSAQAIEELRKRAHNMGLILSDDDIENAVKYKDTMETFSKVFEAKFATVMMKIMPDLSNALEEIMTIVRENQEVFDNLGQAFKWIVGTALPEVIKAIVGIANLLKGLGGLIGTILGQILSIPTYISMAFNTLKTNITIGMIVIGRAIASIADKIKSVFNEVLQGILAKIQSIVEKITWVLSKLPGINSAMKGVISDAVNHINNSNTTNNNDNRKIDNSTTTNNNVTHNHFGGGLLNWRQAQYSVGNT